MEGAEEIQTGNKDCERKSHLFVNLYHSAYFDRSSQTKKCFTLLLWNYLIHSSDDLVTTTQS